MRRFRILVLTPCFLFMEINPSVSWIFIAEIIGCFFPLTHPEIKILQHCFHLPPYLVFSLHIDPDSLCSCIYRAGYTRPAGTDHPWLNKYTTRLRYTHTLVQDQCNNWTCVLYILYAFAFLQIELIGSWSIIQKSLIFIQSSSRRQKSINEKNVFLIVQILIKSHHYIFPKRF